MHAKPEQQMSSVFMEEERAKSFYEPSSNGT
jgi:hypothetical protein